ncbi:MAG: MFS transporter, partial [Myxococcota bacterium]
MASPDHTERRLLLVAATLSAAVTLGLFALPLQLAAFGVRDGALLGWNGLAFGVGVGVSAVVAPWWGALGDRYGKRAMLLRAAGGLALSQLLLAAADAPAEVVVGRVVQGALSGSMPAVMALGRALPGERTARFGKLESANAAGGLAGPVIGAALVWVGGAAWAYVGAAVLALLAGAVTVGLPEVRRAEPPKERSALLLMPEVRRLLGVVFVVEAAQQLVELAWPVLVVRLAPDPGVQAAVLAAVEVAGEGAYL